MRVHLMVIKKLAKNNLIFPYGLKNNFKISVSVYMMYLYIWI